MCRAPPRARREAARRLLPGVLRSRAGWQAARLTQARHSGRGLRRSPARASHGGVAEGGRARIPPSPLRVARRALVLAAMVRRAFLYIERWTDCQETHLRLLRWLDTHKLLLEAEPPEALMLESPVYSLEQPETVDGVWRAHGLAVLAWALGLGEVPEHDVDPHPADLTGEFGLMADSPRALANPVLRSPE
ncbi:DUF4272 domain-containing protein [Archangium sp.]|uniref:DUF4272 domain-containing protein n=1 Tax=Archangium sp. TaxID=1872627 RepID=UPI00389ABF7C